MNVSQETTRIVWVTERPLLDWDAEEVIHLRDRRDPPLVPRPTRDLLATPPQRTRHETDQRRRCSTARSTRSMRAAKKAGKVTLTCANRPARWTLPPRLRQSPRRAGCYPFRPARHLCLPCPLVRAPPTGCSLRAMYRNPRHQICPAGAQQAEGLHNRIETKLDIRPSDRRSQRSQADRDARGAATSHWQSRQNSRSVKNTFEPNRRERSTRIKVSSS